MIKRDPRKLKLRDIWVKFLIDLRSLKPAATFLALSLTFGLIFMVLTPPIQVPDEGEHFYRAYQISELHFIAARVNNGYGGILPVSVETVVPLLRGNLPGHDNEKVSLALLKRASDIKLVPSIQAPIRFDNSTINSPVVYFPQAFGVGIGRAAHINPFWLIYLGRVANLIVWMILLYWAIRITPLGKWAFVVIALNPVSLSQAASLSPDAMQISLAALLVAVVLRLRIYQKPLKVKFLLALIMLIIAVSLLKTAYIPLIFALFLVPRLVVPKRLKYLAVAGACVVGFAWSLIILPMAKTIPSYLNLSSTINSSNQIHYIEHHPLAYVSTLTSNIFGAPSSGVFPTYLGVFGWDDTVLPYWIQIILLLTLVAALSHREEKSAILARFNDIRVWFGLLIIGSIVLLYSLLYTGYTPYASTIIQGVQGRYFIPLTFLVVPITAQAVIQLKVKQTIFSRLMVCFVSFGLLASLVNVGLRFY